jgi:hypothetical protein
LIEDAYTLGEKRGLAVWCCDQAGPFGTTPQPGPSWQPQVQPARRPHEYIRNGTAKILTLFHPADGEVRVQGATTCPNTVLHPWLKEELSAILATLPEHPPTAQASRTAWERWQQGLSSKPTLPEELPPLRLLLVLDNLSGHKTPGLVLWLLAHGIMPLYTPVSGSWLNLTESMQRILKRRALAGQHRSTPEEIMAWFVAVAQQWNKDPTAFVWGGKRKRRRDRQRQRRHRAGGSAGYTRKPVARRSQASYGKRQNK